LIGEAGCFATAVLSRLAEYQAVFGATHPGLEKLHQPQTKTRSTRMAHSSKSPKRSKSSQALEIVNPDAAGIDIGSNSHHVAVPQDRSVCPVRQFGCTTPELHDMARWLKLCGITTVALESTGVYWIPVAYVLEQHGLEVNLVDARHARNVSGRKTDVQDCQWLQQLHSFGLLQGALRPAAQIAPLREYWRQRSNLVKQCAKAIHHMQKSLELMNLQLHKVLTDISGCTGLRILRAIADGQRDPEQLLSMVHRNCKKSKEEFSNALTGNYRPEQIFALTQALERYDFFQSQIQALDQQIARQFGDISGQADIKSLEDKPDRKRRDTKRRKNQPHFDLRGEMYRLTGVDLTQIDGIDANTAFTIITEQGMDMSKFPSERHFASHIGLCPNNQITGGKIKKRRTRKVHSRAATALRVAAQSLANSKTALGAFYRRMRAKHGPAKAITATAHKLAKLIYRMLKYGEDYVDKGMQYYQQQYKERMQKSLAKRAREMGCELLVLETGEVLS
jgi:transposase